MRFFDYCFYRISSAYKSWDSGYYIYSRTLVAASQAFAVLALLSIWLDTYNKSIDKNTGIIILIPFIVFNSVRYSQKRYFELSERWKDEEYKTLKGWLVTLYVIASFALFVAVFFFA